ncbi:hypothetical protein IHE45_13G080800 [Dioscorea alata]|uniref:Uncharacterized protein n=1 Tax=Dioscorea alata TaxID=55571 RepID=A0ACB7UYZ1_DIOAL|nr:hypothetical protein IHE45_13G080800 [Dioscorea alata]
MLGEETIATVYRRLPIPQESPQRPEEQVQEIGSKLADLLSTSALLPTRRPSSGTLMTLLGLNQGPFSDPNKPPFGRSTYDGVIAGKGSGHKWKKVRAQRGSVEVLQ